MYIKTIYVVVVSYYTALVSPCGIHYTYTHLFREARAQRLLVCGRALLAEAHTRSSAIAILVNKHMQ